MTKTKGIHHVGMTVRNVQETANFFIDYLGFEIVGERTDYPSIFISDCTNTITLWEVRDKKKFVPFDRTSHIGLHHIAFKIASLSELNTINDSLRAHNVPIEFAPESLGYESAQHMMFYEPGGIRIELYADNR